ncbi:MAG: chemotaxis protein CheX [bacterium]
MKADHLNPFISAAQDVLQQFLPEIDIELGDPSISDAPTETLGAATYIGISGELEGRVIYDMDRVTATNLASAMNGEEIPGMNELVRSTIQELANVISGNAATNLRREAEDKEIDITPPSMIVGDTEISDSVSRQYITVPLATNHGTIIINLAVRET